MQNQGLEVLLDGIECILNRHQATPFLEGRRRDVEFSRFCDAASAQLGGASRKIDPWTASVVPDPLRRKVQALRRRLDVESRQVALHSLHQGFTEAAPMNLRGV